MEITLAKVRAIFDTLPIGYYLGRNIKVELSETSLDSYFNPIGDNIVISAPTILATARKRMIKGEDVEELIRGLFYHEISHVILTGKVCAEAEKRYGMRGKLHEIVNIFEDERIETILREYYMKTNFRKNIFLINDYNGQPPKNPHEAFYHLVRFHNGKEEFIREMEKLISKYAHLNAASDEYEWERYIRDIAAFYNKVTSNFDPDDYNNEEGEGDSGEGDGEESESSGSGSSSSGSSSDSKGSKSSKSSGDKKSEGGSSSSSEGEDEESGSSGADGEDESDSGEDDADGSGSRKDEGEEEKGKSSGEGDEKSDSKEKAKRSDKAGSDEGEKAEARAKKVKEFKVPNTEAGLGNSIMKKAIEEVLNAYLDVMLQTRIRKLIEMAEKKKGTFGAAYQSYSGRINPRACDRDDCKWWVKDNRTGSNKMYTKTHFNLFIDHSGSFEDCNEAINKLLKALMTVISPDFDFDVITIDTQITEWDRPDQFVFEANGGTDLNNKIAPVFRKHQKRGCNNFNIVVFDGEAHNYGYSQSDEPFNHFDTSNTILVVDSSNERFVRHLHNCKKKIINRDYEKYFIDEVLTLLERTIC